MIEIGKKVTLDNKLKTRAEKNKVVLIFKPKLFHTNVLTSTEQNYQRKSYFHI